MIDTLTKKELAEQISELTDKNTFLQEKVHALQCENLLLGFFEGNEEKVKLWMTCKNPMFGDIEPIQMVKLGKSQKLLKIIRDMLDGNRP